MTKEGFGLSQLARKHATADGQRTVRGQLCNSWKVMGFNTNHLLLRTNDSQICELDNADSDLLVFEPQTYSTEPERAVPSVFAVPEKCDQWCGAITFPCQLG